MNAVNSIVEILKEIVCLSKKKLCVFSAGLVLSLAFCNEEIGLHLFISILGVNYNRPIESKNHRYSFTCYIMF